MNRTDVVVGIVPRLNMIAEPSLNFLNRSICVSDACHGARRVPNIVYGPGELGNDDPGFAATRACGQHQVVIAAYRVPLFRGQRGSASHFAASTRYLGMVLA